MKSAEITSTKSKTTTVIGYLVVAMLPIYLAFGLAVAEPHSEQGESVRLLFVHVPSVLVTYSAFLVVLFSSAMYLRKKTPYWDLLAGASAEVGVVFCAVLLFSGAVWGRPTWGTYWEWDPRMTSTAVMFISYLGYLAVRRMDLNPTVRSRRAAVLGILSFVNVIVVHYSIDWWRSLHQGRTFDQGNVQIEGWYLFSFSLGLAVFTLSGLWLLIHRFRTLYLERQLDLVDLDSAIAERKSEAKTKVSP